MGLGAEELHAHRRARGDAGAVRRPRRHTRRHHLPAGERIVAVVTVVAGLALAGLPLALVVAPDLLLASASASRPAAPSPGPFALDAEVSAELNTERITAEPNERITVVSGADGLEVTFVASLASLDGVIATARVRSATVGLFGSVDAQGAVSDAMPAGYRLPVTVTALEPDEYAWTLGAVPDHDAALLGLLELLGSGHVLLSKSSAALRGIGSGASVDLGGAGALMIVGIVEDRTARGSEFLAHIDDAGAIGLGTTESLVVRHDVSASEGLVRTVAERAGDDVRVWQDRQQVRLVLSQVEVKSRFGEFAFRLVPNQREVDIERAFVAEHITIERMPVLGNVRCHRLIMDDLRGALEEIVDAGLEEWLAPRNFGGCYHPRRIGFGRENLSRHSWGIAIDLNVDFTLPGAGPVPPDEFIAIMGRHGFRWGGDFATPDNHHYEWVGQVARVRPGRELT